MVLDRIREVLSYDPNTGLFRWKSTGSGKIASRPAGNVTTRGYVHICVDGVRYSAHRLAWLYFHGEWPDGHIDHINRDKQDNRIQNLRLASLSENQHNKSAPSNNTSGLKGIRFKKNRWEAACMVNGKRTYLGRFQSKQQAINAYNSHAASAVGEFFVPATSTRKDSRNAHC